MVSRFEVVILTKLGKRLFFTKRDSLKRAIWAAEIYHEVHCRNLGIQVGVWDKREKKLVKVIGAKNVKVKKRILKQSNKVLYRSQSKILRYEPTGYCMVNPGEWAKKRDRINRDAI